MPSAPQTLREQIQAALGAFGSQPLIDASLGLLATLGYQSERRMKLRSNTADGFCGTFDRAKTLTPERALLADWQTSSSISMRLLFDCSVAEV